MLSKRDIYQFANQKKLCVISTISSGGKPESALVGFAITEDLELVFDTVAKSRKYKNIQDYPNVSVVIGWENEITLQYEGEARVLRESIRDDKYREIYYTVFHEGRHRTETWTDLAHIIIKPRWIRYCNFNKPQIIEEIFF